MSFCNFIPLAKLTNCADIWRIVTCFTCTFLLRDSRRPYSVSVRFAVYEYLIIAVSYYNRRRSGWNSGGTHGQGRRWIGAEWGRVCGWVSPLQPTRGSGERRELPQRGPGQSPGQKRILAFSEGHRTLIFVLI